MELAQARSVARFFAFLGEIIKNGVFTLVISENSSIFARQKIGN